MICEKMNLRDFTLFFKKKSWKNTMLCKFQNWVVFQKCQTPCLSCKNYVTTNSMSDFWNQMKQTFIWDSWQLMKKMSRFFIRPFIWKENDCLILHNKLSLRQNVMKVLLPQAVLSREPNSLVSPTLRRSWHKNFAKSNSFSFILLTASKSSSFKK